RLIFEWSECRACGREQFRLRVAHERGQTDGAEPAGRSGRWIPVPGYDTTGQVDHGMSRNDGSLRVYRQERLEEDAMTTTGNTVELLERLRGGDVEARNRLVERALPALLRFARGRLPAYARGAGDTHDLAHDVIVRVL